MEFVLADGTRTAIRSIRAEDKGPLVKAHARLSPETVQRRFLSPKPRLSTADLRYLTEVDGIDHVAMVAVEAERPERILAVGRFVRDPLTPDTAEFAIVVGDPFQRLGLGSLLARLLAEQAHHLEIRRFTATILSDNVAVRRLIAAISQRLTYVSEHDGVRDVVVELAA